MDTIPSNPFCCDCGNKWFIRIEGVEKNGTMSPYTDEHGLTVVCAAAGCGIIWVWSIDTGWREMGKI